MKPGKPVWVSREGVGEDLQRDLAVELRVGGLPDLAHAALAKQISDVIVAETGASGQAHELCAREIAALYAQAATGSTVRQRSLPLGAFKLQRVGAVMAAVVAAVVVVLVVVVRRAPPHR